MAPLRCQSSRSRHTPLRPKLRDGMVAWDEATFTSVVAWRPKRGCIARGFVQRARLALHELPEGWCGEGGRQMTMGAAMLGSKQPWCDQARSPDFSRCLHACRDRGGSGAKLAHLRVGAPWPAYTASDEGFVLNIGTGTLMQRRLSEAGARASPPHGAIPVRFRQGLSLRHASQAGREHRGARCPVPGWILGRPSR